jgi:hypothetical protein
MSEDYLHSLKNRPIVHEGRKMSLAQLTDVGTSIRGYVRVEVLTLSKTGDLLSVEVEFYVVKNMSIPLLLGEDFQQNYEITVSRNVERGTTIRFGAHPYEVEATGVEPPVDAAKIHALTARLTMFASEARRAKEHRRAKGRRRRRIRRNGVEGRSVRVSEDVLIKAHSTQLVKVDGSFGNEADREWLVDRQLLANAEDSFFSVPPTLVTARKPVLPIRQPVW